ncbi:hypothetical protein ACXM2N_00065 [Corynebacterium sp. ZY180755]
MGNWIHFAARQIIKIKNSIKALGGVKAAVSQLAQKGFNGPSIQQAKERFVT